MVRIACRQVMPRRLPITGNIRELCSCCEQPEAARQCAGALGELDVKTHHCWICNADLLGDLPIDGIVHCDTCGPYKISATQAASRFPIDDSERYRFSYWCKRQKLDGRAPLAINEYNIGEIVASLPYPDPSERADILLSSLAKLHPFPGDDFRIDIGREYSLACARNKAELGFHLAALQNAHFLEHVPGSTGSYRILTSGWRRVRELRQMPTESRKAFVAFKFEPDMLALYDSAFAPAIDAAGFDAHRSDDPTHNGKIDAEIIVQIRQSRFAVADSTHANPNVYFEAGYAIALGLPVIWTCNKATHEKDMRFDTRQYNHILWEDGPDLMKQLTSRIGATIT